MTYPVDLFGTRRRAVGARRPAYGRASLRAAAGRFSLRPVATGLLLISLSTHSKSRANPVLRARPSAVHEKVLALTFDDGPDPQVTPRILDALKARGAHGTFFALGVQARRYPDLLKRIVSEGHALGNHSWSHPSRLLSGQARHEVDDTAAVIRAVTGRDPELFRPPYGLMRNGLASLARREGRTVVLWTISSADTRPITPRQIADNIVHTPDPGDIALLHDGPGHARTAEAVPLIVDELSRAGWRFVTVPELMQISARADSRKRTLK